jgi:hypothetical protein
VEKKHEKAFSILCDQIGVSMLPEVLENLKNKMSNALRNFHNQKLEGLTRNESIAYILAEPQTECTLHELHV